MKDSSGYFTPSLVYGGKLDECFMDCGAPPADLHVHVQRVDGGQERTIRC